ncbi:MAG: RMD1 family protein [Calditerrivibrio sp.]|nr:RMD1 family protein [Calditerrivibrio sp.]MCA1980374.1 RMD1 family protein [Calditerrivibrio sp.]
MGQIYPIKIICLAEEFDFRELSNYLSDRFKSILLKDLILININDGGTAIFFNYGVIVLWNIGYDTQKHLLEEVKPFQLRSFDKPIIEDFSYSIDESFQQLKITKDIFQLNDFGDMVKIAISYPLSQSTKLYKFEESISDIIKRNENIPVELSQKGKISMTKKEISRERGRIFLEKSQIYLGFGLLDVPEFFWEYSELEQIYDKVANYLDVKSRVEVLNKKMEIIQDLLGMLADEQKHIHSSFLEMIIILLIAIEIIISIIKW